jgi:hypothetical protein
MEDNQSTRTEKISNILSIIYFHGLPISTFKVSAIAILISLAIIPITYNLSQIVSASTSEEENNVGLDSFVASGNVDSTIYTVSGNWDATGDWRMIVSDGELRSFTTQMAFENKTSGHSHELQNFEAEDGGIELENDRSVRVEGEMDVGTNGATSWPEVPAEIFIDRGKIVTIQLDHEETNNHFGGGGQTIHGTVTSLNPCDVTPGPDMQVPTGCS